MTGIGELTYEREPGFATANLGEELALLDMAKGSYLGLNATAAHVWRLLERPRSLDALCARLMDEFEIDANHCRRDVSTLLGKLLAEGLIRTTDGKLD